MFKRRNLTCGRIAVAAASLLVVDGSVHATPVPVHPSFCGGSLCASVGPALHELKWVQAVVTVQYAIGARSGKYVFEFPNLGKVTVGLDETKPCASHQRMVSLNRDAPNLASGSACGFGPDQHKPGITVSIAFESIRAQDLPEVVDAFGPLWIATIRADRALWDRDPQITVGPSMETQGRAGVSQ